MCAVIGQSVNRPIENESMLRTFSASMPTWSPYGTHSPMWDPYRARLGPLKMLARLLRVSKEERVTPKLYCF